MEGAGLMGIYGALGILAISSAITMIWCIGFILSFIATISFIISLIKGKQIPLGKRIFIIVSSIMIPITIVLLIRTL
ncbi:MAG: hypothetical protein LBU27_06710 [Candidatus Peribacteria bacterium]|jgi:hypothetical protein|nr:hypothetical protein [Candidatus Peribacteria bacterium]